MVAVAIAALAHAAALAALGMAALYYASRDSTGTSSSRLRTTPGSFGDRSDDDVLRVSDLLDFVIVIVGIALLVAAGFLLVGVIRLWLIAWDITDLVPDPPPPELPAWAPALRPPGPRPPTPAVWNGPPSGQRPPPPMPPMPPVLPVA